MKIWVSPYTLKPKRGMILRPRLGSLMKVQWEPGQIGYCDLHPWPEFGEETLEVHLEALANADFTRLCEVAMELSYIDSTYRMRRQSAFMDLDLPFAHRLVLDPTELSSANLKDWRERGFTHVKIKMASPQTPSAQLFARFAAESGLSWRLDMNGKWSSEDFIAWWRGLSEDTRRAVDFIEDPTADGDLSLAGPWADDWLKQSTATIKVVKPAREEAETFAAYDRVVFTHSLDHVFGQAAALWSAAHFYGGNPELTEVCGLASPAVYEEDVFARAWSPTGPDLNAPEGTGFGFDEILESLLWERIL